MSNRTEILCVRCGGHIASTRANFITALDKGEVTIGKTANGNIFHGSACQPYNSEKAKPIAASNKSTLLAWGLKIHSAAKCDRNPPENLIHGRMTEVAKKAPAKSPAKKTPAKSSNSDARTAWFRENGADELMQTMIEAVRDGTLDRDLGERLTLANDKLRAALNADYSPWDVKPPAPVQPETGTVHAIDAATVKALLNVYEATGQRPDVMVSFNINGVSMSAPLSLDASIVRALLA